MAWRVQGGGSQHGLEVGLLIRCRVPQGAEMWCRAWASNTQGQRCQAPLRPAPWEDGRAQTDARSQAQNVLITRSVGDGSSEEEQQSQAWPPRSSDLITCDNSLRGTGKEKISQLRLTSVEDLKTATWDCFMFSCRLTSTRLGEPGHGSNKSAGNRMRAQICCCILPRPVCPACSPPATQEGRLGRGKTSLNTGGPHCSWPGCGVQF